VRYKPSDSELLEIETLSAEQRMHYFLTRTIESEEIWGLGDEHSGWVLKEVDGKTIIPIWPYEMLATACAQQEWDNQTPIAVSLEQFVYAILPKIEQQNIQIEILPTTSQPGMLIDPRSLSSIIEGMMESGEYYMEG
jgi:hypothetical protein